MKAGLVFIYKAFLVSSAFTLLSSSVFLPLPLLVLNNYVKFANGQEIPPITDNEQELICTDGLPPLPNFTCPDGLEPQPRLPNATGAGLPFESPETLLGDNATTSEEIQMDLNGDGIVDELESQNQGVVNDSMQSPEEIQMDLNGDGIVDEVREPESTSSPRRGVSSNGTQTPGQIEGETIPGACLK